MQAILDAQSTPVFPQLDSQDAELLNERGHDFPNAVSSLAAFLPGSELSVSNLPIANESEPLMTGAMAVNSQTYSTADLRYLTEKSVGSKTAVPLRIDSKCDSFNDLRVTCVSAPASPLNRSASSIGHQIRQLKKIGSPSKANRRHAIKHALTSGYACEKQKCKIDEEYVCLDCTPSYQNPKKIDVTGFKACISRTPPHFCEVIHKPVEVFSWIEGSLDEAQIEFIAYDERKLYNILLESNDALFGSSHSNSHIFQFSPNVTPSLTRATSEHEPPEFNSKAAKLSKVHWINFDGYSTYEVESTVYQIVFYFISLRR